MAVLGPERTYLAVNPALCRLLEADAATLTAWSYEQVGHPLDLEAELDACVRLAEGAASAVYQRRFRTARGGEFSAEVRLCAGADGQVLQLVLPGAAPVARGAGQLAERLAQIGSALSHDALEAVRQAGVQAGVLAEVHGKGLEEPGRRCVATIERLAIKAGRQLRALGHFARLGTPVIDPAPVALRPLIEAAWSGQGALPADASLTIAMADGLEWPCDRKQLAAALGAVLANAIAFRTPTQPLQVAVTVTTGPGLCTVSVRDNGQGIAAVDQARLFRVFATCGSNAGVGLGLATVRAVALAHGGSASLSSAPGRGTEVIITLGDAPVG